MFDQTKTTKTEDHGGDYHEDIVVEVPEGLFQDQAVIDENTSQKIRLSE